MTFPCLRSATSGDPENWFTNVVGQDDVSSCLAPRGRAPRGPLQGAGHETSPETLLQQWERLPPISYGHA